MTCVQLLQHLLDHGEWFTSAIELNHDQDGERLRAEAEQAIARDRDLGALLRESKREHYRSETESIDDCPMTRPMRENKVMSIKHECDCGTDAWNAKVDTALGESGE